MWKNIKTKAYCWTESCKPLVLFYEYCTQTCKHRLWPQNLWPMKLFAESTTNLETKLVTTNPIALNYFAHYGLVSSSSWKGIELVPATKFLVNICVNIPQSGSLQKSPLHNGCDFSLYMLNIKGQDLLQEPICPYRSLLTCSRISHPEISFHETFLKRAFWPNNIRFGVFVYILYFYYIFEGLKKEWWKSWNSRKIPSQAFQL